MLDNATKEQLSGIFASLESNFTLKFTAEKTHEKFAEMFELLSDLASCSNNISLDVHYQTDFKLELIKNAQSTNISFRGVPNGHEFTSLLLAILNSDNKGKQPDDNTKQRIANINGPINIKTYVSLSCTNCPDVVQALNLITSIHPQASHEMIDGEIHQEEVSALKLQGVPAVFANGKLLHMGRGEFGELIAKLESFYGATQVASETKNYDVVVVGAGPAGASAAIYSARKGLKTAVVAERIGGQVKETQGIENLISVPQTQGAKLAADLEQHMREYDIDLLEHRSVTSIENSSIRTVHLQNGEKLQAPAVIVATGAKWRELNIPGEKEYIGRGVAFCPHCDGPFYKNKRVAVIGGGNSGIEAAIDLANICSEVTVLEFASDLKADSVLIENAKKLPNVKIFTNRQSLKIIGDGNKVTAIEVQNRENNQSYEIALDGIFVQIGLAPNSATFKDLLNINRFGEIEVDTHCRTNVTGIYAAGDVTTQPYKQIIISMGEGAKAALSAFEDKVRSII